MEVVSTHDSLVVRNHNTEQYNIPFLMSSPLINCCKSNVKLFGATYSAHAVSIDFEINPDMKGRFITLGN